MSDTPETSLTSFSEVNTGEVGVQQSCSYCHSVYWHEVNAVFTTLECGHLLCASCAKRQWLDDEVHEETVFCIICSKMVGVLSVKYEYESKTPMHQQTASQKDDLVGEKDWGTEQADEGLSQDWVHNNMCENYVFTLVQSNADQCITGDGTVQVESGDTASTVSNGMIPTNHCVSSFSALMHERASEVENQHAGYSFDPSISEKKSEDSFCYSTADGIMVKTNVLGSPDLNLKELLQMLEKNTEAASGVISESSEIQPGLEASRFDDLGSQTFEEDLGVTNQGVVCDTSGLKLTNLALSEKHLSDPNNRVHQWHTMGVMPQGQFPQSHTSEPATSQSLPCAVYFQNQDTALSVNDNSNYVCLSAASLQNNPNYDLVKVNTDVNNSSWCTYAGRDFPRKNNPRARRGRKKKPFLRHFQSEFFVRPYQKPEHSPQLQLVKLVRQRSQDKEEDEVKADKNAALHEELCHHSQELDKRLAENPELAFMKTVDMPSGKRVEDIYVVPSVWISSEKKTQGKASHNKGPMGMSAPDFGHYFPMDGPQRIPVQVYSQHNRPHLLTAGTGIGLRQAQGTHARYQAVSSPPIQLSTTKRGPPLSTGYDAHSIKPIHNIYKVIRGHIITTLNAPKVDPIPSLTDLCKAALGLETTATVRQVTEYVNPGLLNGNIPTNQLLQDGLGHGKDVKSEIKTPKEFLDIENISTDSRMKVQEGKDRQECRLIEDDNDFGKEQSTPNIQSFSSQHFPLDEGNINRTDFYENRASVKVSDSEETLPENPLFVEDVRYGEKSEPAKVLSHTVDTCEKINGYDKPECQYNDTVDGSMALPFMAAAPNTVENIKCLYPTSSTIADGKTSYSNYVIPIVSYKISDVARSNHMAQTRPATKLSTEFSVAKNDGRSKKLDVRSCSSPHASVSSIPMGESSGGNRNEDTSSIPSLLSITKQITCLSSQDPFNKPLENLASALNLLCNAEKNLHDSNLFVYYQVKAENKSKLDQLNMCIRKLGDAVITVGSTLQGWMKDISTYSFQTSRVLNDLYTSNITSLIELVTPYFHYISELIGSYNPDSTHWNNGASSKADQSHHVADSESSKQPNEWKATNPPSSDPGCSNTVCSLGFSDLVKSSSPKDFNRQQDYEQSLSSEDIGDVESESSVSGQTSAMTSPKTKVIATTKRGRPLGSKNGQRKSRIGYFKGKTDQKPSPVDSGSSLTAGYNPAYCQLTVSSQASGHMQNTVLINVPSGNFWTENNATIIGQSQEMVVQSVPETSLRRPISYGGVSIAANQPPVCSTSWVLSTRTGESYQHGSVQLSIAPEHSKAYMSMITPDSMQAPELETNTESVASSSESSPCKKLKLEDGELPVNVSTYSDIVLALPQGINIVSDCKVFQQNGVGENLNSLNSGQDYATCLAEEGGVPTGAQNFQNIFFISGAEAGETYVQLDPCQLSAALLNTLKDDKDVEERFESGLIQDCTNLEEKECVQGLQSESLGNSDRMI